MSENQKPEVPNHTAPVNTKMPGIIKPPFAGPPNVKVKGPGAAVSTQPAAPVPGATPAK